jgi:hypothetical protein
LINFGSFTEDIKKWEEREDKVQELKRQAQKTQNGLFRFVEMSPQPHEAS